MLPDSPPRDGSRQERIVMDCRRRRRAAGEVVSDKSLVETHGDLMPQLAAALHNLQLIEAARRQAQRDQARNDDARDGDAQGDNSLGADVLGAEVRDGDARGDDVLDGGAAGF